MRNGFGQSSNDDTINKSFHWEFNRLHIKLIIHLTCTRFLGLQPQVFYLLITISKKEGRVVKVRMDRAGRIVATKEDSYKRVYANDGKSYTYPKIAENRLRVKGQLYFQNMEITGSKEGTEKEPKMALLPYHRDIFFGGWRKWQENWVRKVRKE